MAYQAPKRGEDARERRERAVKRIRMSTLVIGTLSVAGTAGIAAGIAEHSTKTSTSSGQGSATSGAAASSVPATNAPSASSSNAPSSATTTPATTPVATPQSPQAVTGGS